MDLCENDQCEFDLSKQDSGLDLVQVDDVVGNVEKLQQQRDCIVQAVKDTQENLSLQEEITKSGTCHLFQNK